MKVLLQAGIGEIEEKKSRFIATLRSVSSVEEAEAFIDEQKKKYWDARHNCSAFIIGHNPAVTRCSDDGEPAQTAGRPMLDILLKSEVENVAVVVTRYFGGTLLGTGGLVRAYSAAVADALDKSVIGEQIDGIMLTITTDYSLLAKVEYFLNENGFTICDLQYTDNVMLTIQFEENKLDFVKKSLLDISGGTIKISEPEKCTFIKK